MKKSLILPGLVVALLALGAGLGLAWYLGSSPADPAEPSVRLIDFTLPDLEGEHRTLSDWQGKLIVLNFWATWCPPCRDEIPAFVNLQDHYGPRGVQFVGVAIDENQAQIREFHDYYFMNYPILLGTNHTMETMRAYGNRIGTLPFTVLIDPEGMILQRKTGAYTHDELEQLFQKWLPPTSALGAH